MRLQEGISLDTDTVRVTWCTCDKCAALGPQRITVIRHGREYLRTLRAECCDVCTDPRDSELYLSRGHIPITER